MGESPNTAAELEKLLDDHLAAAIAQQSAAGSFDVVGRELDVGDNTLGVVSLLAYGWSLNRNPAFAEPARRGVEFHLRERVFRTDNVGTPYLLITGGGEAHARYCLTPGLIPGGDWPTTVWALLHVVNILRFGDGLIGAQQRAALLELGQSYWRWCTDVTAFDPQDASNQAIACVIAGVQLGELLGGESGTVLRERALCLYAEKIRPARAYDRGYTYFQEHSAGFDQNYGAIALTFATEAYLVTGEQVFFEDAEQHARYLNMRMSVSGFDYGGPRHNEERDNSPSVLGLRFWSNALGDDLGRYLTDSTRAFHMDSSDGVPTGHFAFTTIWLMEHREDWWGRGRDENSRFKLRQGSTSIVFDESLKPYLTTVGQTEIVHRIGPHRTVASAASAELTIGRYSVKVVDYARTRVVYVTDGTTLTVMSDGGSCSLGLPYLSAGIKVTSATCDGVRISLGEDGRTATGVVTAGKLTLSAEGGVRVTNASVPPGANPMSYFNSAASVEMLMEHYSMTVSNETDPWGVPNPDAGWAAVQGATVFEALPNADGVVIAQYAPEPGVSPPTFIDGVLRLPGLQLRLSSIVTR